MKRKDFLRLLENKRYSYKLDNNIIVVTYSRSIDLSSLTTLPDGIQFNNGGYVDLSSLTTATYQGKKTNTKHIDGYTMIINSSKKVDDFIVHKAQYFKGGKLEDLPKCFIAEKMVILLMEILLKKQFKMFNLNLCKRT